MGKMYYMVYLRCLFLLLLSSAATLAYAVGSGTPEVRSIHAQSPSFLFTQNLGQWEGDFRFRGNLPSGKIWLEDAGLTYLFADPDALAHIHFHKQEPHVFNVHVVKMRFEGANTQPEIQTARDAGYPSNFFLGNDPEKWHSNVRTYGDITYKNIYPGIDYHLFNQEKTLKYEFLVAAGGDASSIVMRYDGATKVSLVEGGLSIHTSIYDLQEEAPFAYQNTPEGIRHVPCHFRLMEGNRVGFEFPEDYDKSQPLIIDPTLVFSTHSGSTADNWGFTATYDSVGNFYAGGNVQGFGFPVTLGAAQASYAGGNASFPQTVSLFFDSDIGIMKFTPDGTQLHYATYIGGFSNEQPHSMVVSKTNELFILGTTRSSDYPVTPGVFDVGFNGSIDMVVTRLDSNGSAFLSSTFIGGSSDDGINPEFGNSTFWHYGDDARGEIILDASDNVYIASVTRSNNFPTTAGAFQTAVGSTQDGVLYSLNKSLQTLRFSTRIGGSGDDALYGVTLDQQGRVYAVGATASSNFPMAGTPLQATYQGGLTDGVIVHFNANASSIINSTFVGTNQQDQAYLIQLDDTGFVYTTGLTTGAFPIVNSAYSNANSGQFIQKMTPDLGTRVYSTRFGNGDGNPDITPTALLVDECEFVYVSGWGGLNEALNSTFRTINMPITANAIKSTTDGADFYFIVLRKNAAALHYGSYFGLTNSFLGFGEHVDGGTSRFDRRGVIYQCICAGCGGNTIPTTTGVFSPTNQSTNCNMASVKIDFEALVKARFTVTPSDVCQGQMLNIVNTSNLAGNTYQWDFGDGTSSTQAVPSKTYSSSGTYSIRLIVFNAISCNFFDTLYRMVQVFQQPVVQIVAPSDTCSRTVNYRINGSGLANATYTWRFGDGNTSTQQQPTHTYANQGNYNVELTVTNPAACNTVSTRVINVADFVAPNFNVQTTPCTQTATFQNNSTPVLPVIWSFGDGDTSTTQSPTHTYALPGTYTVKLVTQGGTICADSTTRTVQVPTLSTASFTTQLSGFCDSRAIVKNTSANASNVRWNFGDGTVLSNGPDSLAHTFPAPGTYTIRLTSNADSLCPDSTSQTIIVPGVIPPVLGVNQTPCDPTLTFTNNSTNPSTVFWDFGDGTTSTNQTVQHTYTTTGGFTVRLITQPSAACADTSTRIVYIPQIPVANFTYDLDDTCARNGRFISRSTGATSYNWNLGDGTILANANDTVYHNYASNGEYDVTLTVNPDSSCNSVNKQTIVVGRAVKAEIVNIAPYCDSVVVLTQASQNGNFFIWDLGLGKTSTLANPTVTFPGPGSYPVQLIINPGTACADTDNVVVRVGYPPEARFTAVVQPCLPELFVTNLSEPTRRYAWHLGDGRIIETLSLDQMPEIKYPRPGQYTITLYAYDDVDCFDTASVSIQYDPTGVEFLYIPNVFTPNGDNLNERFEVKGPTAVCIRELLVFDRWGNLVHDYRATGTWWDGNVKGKPATEGAYVYRLLLNNGYGRSATITLLR
jgi:gliding motility-associated-like protein